MKLEIYVRDVQEKKVGNITVLIKDFPIGSSFSRGISANNTISLTSEDLLNLTFTPSLNNAQNVTLSIVAMLLHDDGRTASRSTVLPVKVFAVADKPFIASNKTCIEPEGKDVKIDIFAALTDKDDSELLSINITNVPSSYNVSHSTKIVDKNVFVVNTSRISDLRIYYDEILKPFNITVFVASQERPGGHTSLTKEDLGFDFCKG